MLEGIHIPDITRLIPSAAPSDDRQEQHQRRRPRQRRDDVPDAKTYAPNGQLDEEVAEQEVRHIDLVG